MKSLPIVLLQGWRVPAANYAPLQKKLQNMGFTTIIFDMPGFGTNTTNTKPMNLEDYAVFVQNTMKNLHIDSAIFLCHSFGGRVGLKLSSMFPSRVNSLILCGAPGYRSGNSMKYYISLCVAKLGTLVRTIQFLHPFVETLRTAWYKILGIRDYNKSSNVLRITFRNVVSEKLDRYMKDFQGKALLLWGEFDRLVPVCVARKMNKTIKNSELMIVPGEGHMMPIENSELVSREVELFIQTIHI